MKMDKLLNVMREQLKSLNKEYEGYKTNVRYEVERNIDDGNFEENTMNILATMIEIKSKISQLEKDIMLVDACRFINKE